MEGLVKYLCVFPNTRNSPIIVWAAYLEQAREVARAFYDDQLQVVDVYVANTVKELQAIPTVNWKVL